MFYMCLVENMINVFVDYVRIFVWYYLIFCYISYILEISVLIGVFFFL